MDESLKIMAVMCHPADAIDHAGGTLCLHAQRGDQVTMVVCTHGVDTHHTRRNELIKSGRLDQVSDLEEAIREKEEEALRGMEILGVRDVRFLRLKDDVVIQSRELIEAIAKELADVRPHLLILHNPTEELGFAHQETAEAALRACDLVKTSHYVQDAGDPVTPAQIFFITMYGHTNQLSAEGRRFANVLVDISPVVEKKARALDCVASQYYTGDLGRKCIEVTNGRMGLHSSVSYAEAYQVLNPHVYSHLPANEYLMRQASNSKSSRGESLQILLGGSDRG